MRIKLDNTMKILILGATGRTGRQLLSQALKAGYEVNVLVRNRAAVVIKSDKLIVFETQTFDELALEQAIMGCDAILSALNIARTSDFPWASLRTPSTFLSDTLINVYTVAEKLGVKRIVLTTAWGVSETKADIPGWFRWLIDNSNIGVAYRDHERQETFLKTTRLDWTAVRPVGLTNSTTDKPVLVTTNNQPKPTLMISRYNVAKFMLNILAKAMYQQQAITISER
jgi:putative NADH-flavin reductase